MKRLLLPVFNILSILLITGCADKKTLFTLLSPGDTGVRFNNTITENDSINPIDMEYLYNGGGVAVGDFNNDSLPDLFFTGNQVPNNMYLNKGNMKFTDITSISGTAGNGAWSNAASVIDINNDGWDDIYICTSILRDAAKRQNQLYVNQGPDRDGVPRFREMAAAYNLADTGLSVHAAFFDFDNDGDLDVYLVNTKLAQRNSTRFDGAGVESMKLASDKLFENKGIPPNGDHPIFEDVSLRAGIHDSGYGLGVSIADLNDDGFKDIFVTNDFFSSDLLYINQGNGRFKEMGMQVFKHSSQSAMGNDIADLNNDGLADIIAVDMLPQDNYRRKKNMGGNNYYLYQSMSAVGLLFQYTRNTLQLNNGLIDTKEGTRIPLFSEIAFFAGVAETDWSWSPLAADFDNDGFRDLLITNGYPKDVTDQDFGAYSSSAGTRSNKRELLAMIPQVKIANYAYQNTGSLKFSDVTGSWGINRPSFSTGAAYADLDNDGDLDYIVSNINDEAFVYRNNQQQQHPGNFLRLNLQGDNLNRRGLGALVKLYAGDKKIITENYPYRGYLSSVSTTLHIGLGSINSIDSLSISWANGSQQTLLKPGVNQLVTARQSGALIAPLNSPGAVQTGSRANFSLLSQLSSQALGIDYLHTEFDYIDFDMQPMLPHKLSEYNPCLAVADVDGNGTDDLFVGASTYHESYFFLQTAGGRFQKKQLLLPSSQANTKPEISGALLFDADNDGDVDLYCASGSNEFDSGHAYYQDRFFLNDGKGNFSFDSMALPANRISKSCVRAADYDGDGDLDLFIGGRSVPHKYPAATSSMLFRNDSKAGRARFTDVTAAVAPGLLNIGMVCDGLWSDYDNDGKQDLVVVGEWMTIKMFHNVNGKLVETKLSGGAEKLSGWFTSIAGGDFDNDGDIDYVIGNLGENSFYRADSAYPATVYGSDFGKNKNYMAIPSMYLPDQQGKKKEYPTHSRNDMTSQLPALKKRFLSYKSFAEADMSTLFGKELSTAYKLQVNYSSSLLMENRSGQFVVHRLPEQAQFAPINGIVADDVNQDGFLDILYVGNDFGTEVSTGRYDAMNGGLLLGDGKGKFTSCLVAESGFYVPGNAKGLVKLRAHGDTKMYIASQNRDSLKIFRSSQVINIALEPGDQVAEYMLGNGSKRREEFYYGTSFLSQSGRFISLDRSVQRLTITNNLGVKRVIKNPLYKLAGK